MSLLILLSAVCIQLMSMPRYWEVQQGIHNIEYYVKAIIYVYILYIHTIKCELCVCVIV